MRELRGKGLSLRAIADALAEDGTSLSHVAVKKVLERNGGSERSAPEEKASTGQPALGTRW